MYVIRKLNFPFLKYRAQNEIVMIQKKNLESPKSRAPEHPQKADMEPQQSTTSANIKQE